MRAGRASVARAREPAPARRLAAAACAAGRPRSRSSSGHGLALALRADRRAHLLEMGFLGHRRTRYAAQPAGSCRRLPAMCFELDSEPPIPRIAGAAVSHDDLVLEAAGRQSLRRLSARCPTAPADRDRDPAGRPRASTASTRSSLSASPSAGSPRSPSTTSAGRPGSRSATTTSTTCRTSSRRRPRACRPTSPPCVRHLRALGCTSVFTVGFCFGGRNSWLAAASGHGLAGAIGFYGQSVAERPASGRRTRRRIAAPDPRAAGGRRPRTSHEINLEFERALLAAGKEYELSSTRARRTASSTASRRSSPTPPTTPGARARVRRGARGLTSRTRWAERPCCAAGEPDGRPAHAHGDPQPARSFRSPPCSPASPRLCGPAGTGSPGRETRAEFRYTAPARGAVAQLVRALHS